MIDNALETLVSYSMQLERIFDKECTELERKELLTAAAKEATAQLEGLGTIAKMPDALREASIQFQVAAMLEISKASKN